MIKNSSKTEEMSYTSTHEVIRRELEGFLNDMTNFVCHKSVYCLVYPTTYGA